MEVYIQKIKEQIEKIAQLEDTINCILNDMLDISNANVDFLGFDWVIDEYIEETIECLEQARSKLAWLKFEVKEKANE